MGARSETVEVARKARAALRAAFPKQKFSATSDFGGVSVRWTDDGPTVEALKEALLAAGCAVAKKDFQGDHYLVTADGDSYYFDRYYVAQRAAEQEKHERRRLEREAEDQRVNEVIAQERATRYSALPFPVRQALPPIQNPSVLDAFEHLRQRAEVEAKVAEDAQRRPSWAPPLLLGEELAEVCLALGYLSAEDKWVGRLWSEFASPKRSQRWLRERYSELPLAGLRCRGFSLWAGAARGGRAELLFEAQREEGGSWRFGPTEPFVRYYSPRGREWERLIREREQLRQELHQHRENLSEGRLCQIETGLANCARRLEALDAEDLAGAKGFHDRQRLQQRARELARARVLEFVGGPDAQMQTAARLWGHCCVCGKALTDPLSLERGIGPDCYGARTDSIRALARRGYRPEGIAAVTGAELEFIAVVLEEHKQEVAP